MSVVPAIEIQNLRPADRRGMNVFETPKSDLVRYNGFKLNFGAAFTQQFQGLDHSNSADVRLVSGVNANELIRVGHGFNNANANLFINAQVAPGIRVAMTSYLSSRHHNDTWVKDGYLQIDASPIDMAPLHKLMEVVTLKAGHFEINYGDQHFRRTDNGQSIYNPLVGNFILDAFTTQVGTEVYLRHRGLMAMGAITNGEVRGMTLNPQRRSAAYITKLGFDKQLTEDLRVRLTGSTFAQAKAANQTLYSGDRAGSRYYNMVENTTSTEAANFTSGAINPQFNEMHAYVINPFVKFHGLELFGNVERARGKQAAEAARREYTQNVGEVTYRFLDDALFVSGRVNKVEGRPMGYTTDIKIDRTQFGAGWFINPMILLKGEYVNQKYDGFAATDIRNGAKFKGYVIEAAVAF
ncbi:MAG: hypothetical protein H0X64_12490 [Gemmatimonadaceae bacterium]|nr:hypothetical protein [Gemmatimonadaceae bacterium]